MLQLCSDGLEFDWFDEDCVAPPLAECAPSTPSSLPDPGFCRSTVSTVCCNGSCKLALGCDASSGLAPRVGLKRPPPRYEAARLAAITGCNTAIGSTYFLVFKIDSSTP